MPMLDYAYSDLHCETYMRMKGQDRLVIVNELDSLERLTDFLNGIGAEQNWRSDTLFDLNLCAEEAVVNVIVHGYEDKGSHLIEVLAEYDRNSVTLTVIDDGIPYNPLDTKGADIHAAPEDRTPGGLGVHLMRALMHELVYRREDDKNHFSMKKHLKVTAVS